MRSIQSLTDWQSARKSLQKSLLCATVALTALNLAPAQKFWLIGPGTRIDDDAQGRISTEDISDNGIAVGNGYMGRNAVNQAFIFDTLRPTLTLPYDEWGSWSGLEGISSDGKWKAGWKYYSAGSPARSVFASEFSYFGTANDGVIYSLITLPDGNPAGVGRFTANNALQPALFRLAPNGAVQEINLGIPSGGLVWAFARGIARKVESDTAYYYITGHTNSNERLTGNFRAVLWKVRESDNAVLQRLILQPRTDAGEDATAFARISADARTIVGGYRVGSPQSWRAFLYFYNPQTDEYVRGNLPILSTSDYPLQMALDTNADGTLIVGTTSTTINVS